MPARGYENLKMTFFDKSFQIDAFEQESVSQLLAAASRAVTNPIESGYHVKTAAIGDDGQIVSGGNREYGLSRAHAHGEESVVNRFKSVYGNEAHIVGIGFYGGNPEKEEVSMISPCGNCRDVLIAETSPNLLVVSGNERIATIARLSSFLFDAQASKEALDEFEKQQINEQALDFAKSALEASVRTYLKEGYNKDRAYGVSLVDSEGLIFPGSLYTTAGYDATSPGVAAIQSYRNRPSFATSEYRKVSPIETVVVVRKSERGELPDVLYRDRNAILEHDETTGFKDPGKGPAKVYLVGIDNSDTIRNLAATDVLEWLPFPFTNNALGMTQAIRDQYESLQKGMDNPDHGKSPA